MLFSLLNGQLSLTEFILIGVVLLLSLTVHEFAHAWSADRLGDRTPRRYGRVTLNPLRHLDLFGSLLILTVGFGFARPVPVNFGALGRWGGLWVALAGPLSNLLIALIGTALLRVALAGDGLNGILGVSLLYIVSVNVLLAVFNLLPIPMFDGSRVIAALFPRTLGRSLLEFEMQPYAFLIVLAFIFIARGPIGQLIGTIQSWLFRLVGLV